MNELDIKETMEQIHISKEMQEQIIANIQNQINPKTSKTRNWKKTAAIAAAFVLAIGIISIPVQALVQNIVRARMENIPEEELQNMMDIIRGQRVNADSFSREYSDTEKKRMKELRQLYQNGTFPENKILQVENKEKVVEGTLCFANDTSFFYLPDRELTDEEILEILDFEYTRDYAIEQSPAAQEMRKEQQEEQDRLREQIQEAGGISEEEAVEIARNQMKAELGPLAEGKDEIQVVLRDISEASYDHKGDVAYRISFRNPKDYSTYLCTIDSGNGEIIKTVNLDSADK